MRRLICSVRSFLTCEEAATATEYAVMLGLLLAIVLVTVGSLGLSAKGAFHSAGGDTIIVTEVLSSSAQ